jgi:hypothetical protein
MRHVSTEDVLICRQPGFKNLLAYSSEKNRYNSVSIATGSTAGVRFPGETSDFSVLHNVQTGSGAHPISFPKGIADFHWRKAAGAWSWPLTSTKCRRKERWRYISTLPYAFVAQGQIYLWLDKVFRTGNCICSRQRHCSGLWIRMLCISLQ